MERLNAYGLHTCWRLQRRSVPNREELRVRLICVALFGADSERDRSPQAALECYSNSGDATRLSMPRVLQRHS